MEGGGRESPGMRVPFFRVAERKEPKKGRPHCLRPLRFASGQPAVLGFGGVSLELASLRQSRALIRQTLRSSAHPEGQGSRTSTRAIALRSAPTRGRKRHALRGPSRAQRWPEWLFGCSAVWMFGCPPPAGCACGEAVVGWHARRSARASSTDSPWMSERSCNAAQ